LTTDLLLDWSDGTPRSRHFGDIYFSRDGGLDETRHVFLRGNRLEQRFAALGSGDAFAIGETGFGTGLNFLCAWQLFDRVAPAGARLHFVSTELHPLSAADLRRCAGLWPELAAWYGPLCDAWGPLPPAFHRFVFAGGRVTLTLLAGDAQRSLPELDARLDAWFLDGFAPARNPGLWSGAVLHEVSRLCRRGATVATYTAAGAVRRGLEQVGFRVDRTPGFGAKRHMLQAVCERPAAPVWSPPWQRTPAPVPTLGEAVVVGAGLAGTAAAASLAARGFRVSVLDRSAAPAAGASGNAQAVLYVKPSAHDTPLTALVLAGLGLTRRTLPSLLPEDGERWSGCGVLVLPEDEAEALRQSRLAALGWPDAFVRAVDRDQASALAGLPMPMGGLFYADAGWVHPPALCAALLRRPGVVFRPGLDVQSLARQPGGRWQLGCAGGEAIEADVVVVASALEAMRLGPLAGLPLKGIRGQVTLLPATPASAALRTVICGASYAAPARSGQHCVGATFDVHDASDAVRVADNADNLRALAALAPSLHAAARAAALEGAALPARAGVRCVTPDYLPVAGPVADGGRFAERFAALRHDARLRLEHEVPWHPGLFVSLGHGSRGLVTTLVCAELIASQAAGEPLPLPRRVVSAVAQTRFPVRALTRGPRDAAPRG
jgi:tRNA 5-methylaminomethyl-2-thiouridine biosynthesis bifunctional protein